MNNVFDLPGQLEVLVRDALGGMVMEADFHPRIRGGDIRMMPGGLREMADRVDQHERPFPAVRAILSPDPAALQVPVRQVTLESLLDLCIRVGAFLAGFGHGVPPNAVDVNAPEIANQFQMPQSNPLFRFEKPDDRKISGDDG